MSTVINIVKLFVKTDDKLILFVSYGGKHYSDSPKCIFEKMKADGRFEGYQFVWAFTNPDFFDVPGARKIKIDTPQYYLTALKARCWITNVIIERALNFTGKKTFYLCTSHGIPIKEVNDKGGTFNRLYHCLYDVIMAQSEFDKEIQKVDFDLTEDHIKILGYPRNDKFALDHKEICNKVRTYFNIPHEKKIVLYAPTYRDWNNGYEEIPFNVDKWKEEIGDKYVLLFRAHPTSILMNAPEENDFFRDASKYEDLDDILISADVLISDYSSMFFDYSILHRPMICWAYDYEKFCEYRKLRVDLPNEVYGGEIKEDKILDVLKYEKFDEIVKKAIAFQEKYVTVYGNASEKAIDLVYNKITREDY